MNCIIGIVVLFATWNVQLVCRCVYCGCLMPKLSTLIQGVETDYVALRFAAQHLNHVGINAVAVTWQWISLLSFLIQSFPCLVLLVRWHLTPRCWHWEECLCIEPTIPAVAVKNTYKNLCQISRRSTHQPVCWALRMQRLACEARGA